MKTLMRTIAAAIVFAALLIYAFSFERGRVPHEDEVFGLDIAQATRLQVTTKTAEIEIVKKDDEWYATKPFTGLVNQEDAEKRLRAIAELKPTGTRSGVDLKSDQFELKDPLATATLDYGRGKSVTLLLGATTPVGSEVYASIKGKSDLYILSSSVKATLIADSERLREKHLVRFDKDSIDRVRIAYADVDITMTNQREAGKDHWLMTKPVSAPADEFQVEQLLSRLADMKAHTFVNDVKDNKTYGLDKPRVRIELDDTEGARHAISIGSKAEDASLNQGMELCYAKADGRDEVSLIGRLEADSYKQKPLDLRDKSLVDLQRENVNYVSVQSKNGLTFTMKRLPTGWSLDKPTKAPAKAARADDILWDIVQLEALDYVEENPKDLKKYGLAVPDVVIEVRQLGSGDVLKLKFGYAKGKDAHYLQTSGSSQVYLCRNVLLDDLPMKLDDIKQ